MASLLLGSALTLLNLAIQVWAVWAVIGVIRRRVDSGRHWRDAGIMIVLMTVLFIGHLLQFATWALLFRVLGEFSDFSVAYYHSAVNFTSLGYGDIVMSERWRLLGALEAANGVLMFGLTAGLVLAVMMGLLRSRPDVEALLQRRAERFREEERSS